jgi:hypothetical protein
MMPSEALLFPGLHPPLFSGTWLEAGGVVAMSRAAFFRKGVVMAYYKFGIRRIATLKKLPRTPAPVRPFVPSNK